MINRTVVHIVRHDPYQEKTSGVAHVVRKLVDFLKQHGTRVQVLTFDDRVLHIPIVQKLLGNYDLLLPSEAMRVLKDICPAIVHLHGVRGGIVQSVSWVCRKMHIPYIVQLHGELSARYPGSKGAIVTLFDLIFSARVLRGAETILVPTPIEMNSVRRFVPFQKIRLLPNCIDASAFKRPSKKHIICVSKYFLEGGINIVTLSRIHPVKGIPEIMPAIARLRRILGRPVRYIIVGPDDGDLQRVLEAARQFNVDLVYAGPLFDDYKRAMLRLADVFLLPSKYEGFGLAALEAMAQGTVPVVSDRGGAKWVVGNAGFVFRYGDIVDASSKLKMALSSKLSTEVVERARFFLCDRILAQYYLPILEEFL